MAEDESSRGGIYNWVYRIIIWKSLSTIVYIVENNPLKTIVGGGGGEMKKENKKNKKKNTKKQEKNKKKTKKKKKIKRK